ncbi:BTAD domain-containing putative transcriptional regulator [Kribbella sp. CA-247076]|uniref:BTAD domain-containing putative transcriptional regulator n=1 Tax=Kribbella sp. CA-247076 TaxID=3239941 RepID=UPI003D8CDFCC
MQVRVLGGVELVVDGSAVDLGGPKQRALLAILVAADGQAVSADRLVDLLWGDEPPAKAVVSLHAYVARLRRLLEPVREPRAPATVLVSRAPGYALLLDGIDVDARQFTRLLADAVGADPARTEHLLQTALDLWHGEAFGGLPGTTPVVHAEATRLEELRLTALEDLWTARLALGRHAHAVPELERLVERHPLRERLWALLALALYRSSRQAEALDALRRARRRLVDEAGLDPGVELRDLETAILRQAPDLQLPSTSIGLAGRDIPLREVRQALTEAAAGHGRVVLVSGEAGIGKTCLAQAVAEQAKAAGFRCGWGGWEPDASAPLWGWQQSVQQLFGDTGILRQAGPEPIDTASSTFRLAGALVDALRTEGASLLVLDDLHWADADSLRLLRRVAATLSDVPALLLVTCRDTESDISSPVAEVLAALARFEPVRIRLDGLDEAAVQAQVQRQTGVEVDARVAAAIRGRTDGNPFYVNEFVRLLAAAGDLSDPAASSWREVPGGVRDVVRQRLAQLPGEAGDLLATAAVLGRSFELDVLQAAVEAPAEVLDDAVGAALRSGLLEEETPNRYRFTHALVRDAIYRSMTAPARSRAHARVAQALERRRIGHLEPHTAQLAEHYRLAGPVHARSAWTFANRAARRAADRSTHDEATRLFRMAAELQDQDPLVTAAEREAARAGLGQALHWSGRPLEAWASLADAAQSALQHGEAVKAARALVVITAGAIWTWREYPVPDQAAIDLWEQVLAKLPGSEALLRAQVQAALAIELLYQPGAANRATALVTEAVRVTRRAGSAKQLVRVLQLGHLAQQRPDLLDRRIAIADELVTLAGRIGDPAELAAALCKRAVDRAEAGAWASAVSDLHRAYGIAEQHQFVPAMVVATAGLSLERQAVGDFAGAEEAIERLQILQATVSMAPEALVPAHYAALRMFQGRLAELEPALRATTQGQPVFRDFHALALLAGSRTDEARMLLGDWSEQPPLNWDFAWIVLTILRARVWLGLGDARAIADLRAQLAPFADRLAVGGLGSFFLGSVHHTLGELALAAGDRAAAREHLLKALEIHERLGFAAFALATGALLRRTDLP